MITYKKFISVFKLPLIMPDRIPEETKQEIRELYKEGNTPYYIAKVTGVSYSSVYGLTAAAKKGLHNYSEYVKFRLKENGFASSGEYADYLARLQNFKSYSQYRLRQLQEQGFPTRRAYYDAIARRLKFKSHRDRLAKIAQSEGCRTYSQLQRQKIKDKYKTYIRYEDELARKNGFKSHLEREKEREKKLARKRGFKSVAQLRDDILRQRLKQGGFSSLKDYKTYMATQKHNYKTLGEYEKHNEQLRQQKRINQELSSLIKSSLEELGKSQVWLAKQLGVTEGAVSRYISAKVTPRPELQPKLFKILNLKYKTLDDILQPSN
jgi:ribosome-binding protein aMBF1 (putative translation factor)